MNSSIGDAQLQPREVRSDAAVDAEAEGGVTIRGAVDDELVGVFEYLRVTIGRGKAQQDPVVLLHRTPEELVVLRDEAGHRDRRVETKELLDRHRE